MFLTLTVPIPQKNVPSFEMYHISWKGINTNKYRVYLDGITSSTDLFKLIKQQILKERADRFDYFILMLDKDELHCKQCLNLSEWSDDPSIPIE